MMSRVRLPTLQVKVPLCQGCDIEPERLHVDLPAYSIDAQIDKDTVLVTTLASYLTPAGEWDRERIRAMYKGSEQWDRPDLKLPDQVTPATKTAPPPDPERPSRKPKP